VTNYLQKKGRCDIIPPDLDESEHSLELQLSFLAHTLNSMGASQEVTIVPILVGFMDSPSRKHYAQLFSQYLEDESNFFIVSSDFCHWGERFDYTYLKEEMDEFPVWQQIEKLDREGMDSIEKVDVKDFVRYVPTFFVDYVKYFLICDATAIFGKRIIQFVAETQLRCYFV
jgi:AmmeMemoRadiSam system protein B